jgi:hypothetical protein
MKNLLERIKSLYENPKEFAKDLGKKALEFFLGRGTIENLSEGKTAKGIFKAAFVVTALVLGGVFLGPMIATTLGVGSVVATIAGVGVGGLFAQKFSRGVGMSSTERSDDRIENAKKTLRAEKINAQEEKISKARKPFLIKAAATMACVGIACFGVPFLLAGLLIGVKANKDHSELQKATKGLDDIMKPGLTKNEIAQGTAQGLLKEKDLEKNQSSFQNKNPSQGQEKSTPQNSIDLNTIQNIKEEIQQKPSTEELNKSKNIEMQSNLNAGQNLGK